MVKKGFLLILSIIPSVILLSCNIIELTVLNLSLHTSSKFLLSTRIIVLTNSLYKISRRYAKDQLPSLYTYVRIYSVVWSYETPLKWCQLHMSLTKLRTTKNKHYLTLLLSLDVFNQQYDIPDEKTWLWTDSNR